MGRVTERLLVAVMLLTAATADTQETESSPLGTDRQDQDQDPLVQQFTASVSQLQQQCQSHQQSLSEQMSKLEKRSQRDREDLAELTLRVDRLLLLQQRSLNHQADLAELTMRIYRLLELQVTNRSDHETMPQERSASFKENMSQQISQPQERSASLQENMSQQISQPQERSASLQENMSQQISQLQERSASLQENMSQQISQLQEKSPSHQENLSRLQERSASVQETVSELRADMATHASQLTSLTEKIDRLPRDLSSSEVSSASCKSSCRSSCKDWKRFNPRSGVRTVLLCQDPVKVYCDQTTDNGGWTVFQRRVDDSVDFYRNWTDYRNGFGDLEGNFWLGLDKLYILTSSQKHELRVDLQNRNGTRGHATYSGFYVDSPSNNFTLNFDNFTGGYAGDSLSYHRWMQFSTKDVDNDRHMSANCAQSFHGAWWFKSCFLANLNGGYKTSSAPVWDGIIWGSFGDGDTYSMDFSEMKIRPM